MEKDSDLEILNYSYFCEADNLRNFLNDKEKIKEIDNEVLDMLSKKQTNVNVILYTLPNANINKTDIKRFNNQYPTLKDNRTTKVHDRYLIIDNTELYTIGASLKDLGKKCFSFTKMEEEGLIVELLSRLN